MDIISAGDDTLTFKSDENISRAVANNAVLLAGVTVNRIPLNGIRDTNNLATAVTLTDNSIVITISTSVVQGDEFFVQLKAGLVENSAGNTNAAVELNILVDVTTSFGVADLVRSTATLYNSTFVPDDYRVHFVALGIRSGTAGAGEYRLGLKETSKPAPTVSELLNASASITRTLAPKKINVYLPFHIEGTYFDTGATQNRATAVSALLSANTKYSLYITSADGSGTVEKALDITTDTIPTTTTDVVMYGLPPSIYEYTIREQEATILQAIALNTNGIDWYHNDNDLATCVSILSCIPPQLGMAFYIDGENYIVVLFNPSSGVYSAQNSDGESPRLDSGKFIVQSSSAE